MPCRLPTCSPRPACGWRPVIRRRSILRVADEALRLAEPLWRCCTTSLVELSVCPSTFTLELSDRPLASKIARWQAETSVTVTNRRHESQKLTDFHRRALRWLDGQHDRGQLMAELTALVDDGSLAVHEHGERIHAAERVRSVLKQAIDVALPQLAHSALIIG